MKWDADSEMGIGIAAVLRWLRRLRSSRIIIGSEEERERKGRLRIPFARGDGLYRIGGGEGKERKAPDGIAKEMNRGSGRHVGPHAISFRSGVAASAAPFVLVHRHA
jgi:hypothetical protein